MTQPTPTELLAQRLRDHAQVHDDLRHMDDEQQQWSDDLRQAADILTLSAREDGWQVIGWTWEERSYLGNDQWERKFGKAVPEFLDQAKWVRNESLAYIPKAPTAGEGKS